MEKVNLEKMLEDMILGLPKPILSNLVEVRGGSNINNRRLVYLSDKIINEIMSNPDKFHARANKESITNRYKDRQDKIKRQNKHFFVENKSQQNIQ